MLKIEQFAREQYGINLTEKQLEMIAILASGKNVEITGGRMIGKSTARKTVLAYLQDGMKPTPERKWWVTNKDAPADNQKVVGPFTTSTDAAVAREYIERKSQTDKTYWLEEL